MNAVRMLRKQHDVKTLCRVLRVNRSTYYKHFTETPSHRASENQRIRSAILEIYSKFDKRLGAYKIKRVLERDYGICISVGRVYRLMRCMKLPKMSTDKPKKQYRNTNTDNAVCSNHLKQQFSQAAPNMAWVSDFTYIKAGSRWYYLCVVIDLFSRKVISWNLSDKPDTALVMNAFRKAYVKRGKPKGLIFHSDRGTQYTSEPFRRLLSDLNIIQSFSKKGYPFDNAVCESFFKHFKREEANRRTYHSVNDLHNAIFEYIDGFYNSIRPHASLNNFTPDEVEAYFVPIT